MKRSLLALGEGAYSVAETCRILGPTVTPRKVHYWLDTGLISGAPISRGRRGVPTVLTFRQLLEIRTVQHLRTAIGVSLREVRAAYEWILTNLFEERQHIKFLRGPHGTLVARLADGQEMTVPGGQGLLPTDTDHLTESVEVTLQAWDRNVLPIDNHPRLVSSTRVLGGAPVVKGTRVDTAVLATFALPDRTYSEDTVSEIRRSFSYLSRDDVTDALRFEGLSLAG